MVTILVEDEFGNQVATEEINGELWIYGDVTRLTSEVARTLAGKLQRLAVLLAMQEHKTTDKKG